MLKEALAALELVTVQQAEENPELRDARFAGLANRRAQRSPLGPRGASRAQPAQLLGAAEVAGALQTPAGNREQRARQGRHGKQPGAEGKHLAQVADPGGVLFQAPCVFRLRRLARRCRGGGRRGPPGLGLPEDPPLRERARTKEDLGLLAHACRRQRIQRDPPLRLHYSQPRRSSSAGYASCSSTTSGCPGFIRTHRCDLWSASSTMHLAPLGATSSRGVGHG